MMRIPSSSPTVAVPKSRDAITPDSAVIEPAANLSVVIAPFSIRVAPVFNRKEGDTITKSPEDQKFLSTCNCIKAAPAGGTTSQTTGEDAPPKDTGEDVDADKYLPLPSRQFARYRTEAFDTEGVPMTNMPAVTR